MKRRSRPRLPRGFLLVEILVWLTIMTAVMLLMTEMMVAGMRIQNETTRRDILIARVDAVLDAMRRDAWRARSIEAIGSQVVFVGPDGVVLWRMEAGKNITRVAPAETPLKKTWTDMPAFTFSANGSLVKVDVESETGAARHESTTLVSQRMLNGGAP